MKWNLAIMLTIIFECAYAQDFLKLANVDSFWAESITSIVKLDGNHVLLTSTGESNGDGSPWHMINRKIASDTLREIWKKEYFVEVGYDMDPINVNFNTDKNLIISGTLMLHDHNLRVDKGDDFVCEMTPQGEVIWGNSFGEKPIKNWALDITQVDDGGYMTAGWKNRPENIFENDATLRKLSVNGDSLWTVIIRDSSNYRSYRGTDILPGDSNTVLFIYHKHDPDHFSIAKFDATTGSMYWNKDYPKGWSNGIYNALQNEDGNMVIMSLVRYDDYCEPAIWEIDQNGDILSYNGFNNELGCSLGGKISQTNDGGYAFLQRGKNHPHFVKVSSDYEFEFLKIYPIESPMPTEGVVQMDDGSYILAGYEATTAKYTIWLIKTDSVGDFVSILTPDIPEFDISVYPNPTSDNIKIELNEDHFKNLRLLLMGIDSRIVIDQNNLETIDLSLLVDGLYFLHIFDGDKLIGIKKIIKQNGK